MIVCLQIVASCILAVVSAGYVGHYHGHHIPVLDHNGYQLDEPAVAHAKAAHFAAHAEANARGHGHGLYAHVAHLAYAGHYHGGYIPSFDHNGYQLDTPEVAHARAAHLATHAKAHGHYAAPYGYGAPYVHGAVVPLAYGHAHNGAPLDTPEVAHAKVAHAAAHAEARARNGDYHHHY